VYHYGITTVSLSRFTLKNGKPYTQAAFLITILIMWKLLPSHVHDLLTALLVLHDCLKQITTLHSQITKFASYCIAGLRITGFTTVSYITKVLLTYLLCLFDLLFGHHIEIWKHWKRCRKKSIKILTALKICLTVKAWIFVTYQPYKISRQAYRSQPALAKCSLSVYLLERYD